MNASAAPAAIRDPGRAHPVAGTWRPIFAEVVHRFALGDFTWGDGVRGVAPISEATAGQIRDYIADYGATLTALPEATWETSVAQSMGSTWHVLVDLWTVQEGRSDLVLHADVEEVGGDAWITVRMVYVP